MPKQFAGRSEWFELNERITDKHFIATYIGFMASARHSYLLATGDLTSHFYETNKVINSLIGLLERPESKRIVLVFQIPPNVQASGISEETPEEELRAKIQSELKERNPKIVKVAKEYPEKVSLYVSRSPVRQHVAIADEKHVLFQEPDHSPEGPEYIYARYDDVVLARKWQQRFEDLLTQDGVFRLKFDG